MIRLITLSIIVIMSLLIISCKLFEDDPKTKEVLGCTDPIAYNYIPNATEDDGSCDYCTGKPSSAFLLISLDCGITWKRKCFDIPVSYIDDISITDSNNIWVCASPWGTGNAQIFHTNNGGYTWHKQYEGTESDEYLHYIEMFDNSTGVAMGDGLNYHPIFLKTTNGGITWKKTTLGYIGNTENFWRTIDFVDMDNGYFYGSIPELVDTSDEISHVIIPAVQKLYQTTDSGYIWNETNFNHYAYALSFFNNDIGLIGSQNREIYGTTDGGDTWNKTNVVEDYSELGRVYDIAFHPSNYNEVWISSGGQLYKSNDMGTTLIRQSIESDRINSTDLYVGETKVWAVGQWGSPPLYLNRDLSQDNWELINLPLHENKEINGIIDGVGDNIIVIPGRYY